MPGFPVHHQVPELAQTYIHQVGDVIKPSHLLLSLSLPDFNLSQHQVFSDESVFCIRWPKYWSFSVSISPSNEYSGLISFRTDLYDLPTIQGILKSLLQYHSSKALILWCSAFFMVQLPHPYMSTGKTIALTRWNFVEKVMFLLFNMLPRLAITFLPRSSVFYFHGCSHYLQLSWSPRKYSLLLFPLFPHLFAIHSYKYI